MSNWTRPATVPFPSTWATFKGQKELNGSKRTYWIQDITDEYKNEIVKYMVEEFTNDEPLCKYSKLSEVKEALSVFQNMWEKCLSYNLGLVCLTKDKAGKPTIAAMNCTTICTIDDKSDIDIVKYPPIEAMAYIKKQGDAFNRLNVTEYLDALGLYVLPQFRGEGLGLQLLKAREPLSKACGLTTSVTFYSSVISQKLADRAGFTDLYTVDYVELEKINPRFCFPGILEHSKGIRLMYIVYK